MWLRNILSDILLCNIISFWSNQRRIREFFLVIFWKLVKGEIHQFYTSKSVYRSLRVLMHIKSCKKLSGAPEGVAWDLINSCNWCHFSQNSVWIQFDCKFEKWLISGAVELKFEQEACLLDICSLLLICGWGHVSCYCYYRHPISNRSLTSWAALWFNVSTRFELNFFLLLLCHTQIMCPDPKGLQGTIIRKQTTTKKQTRSQGKNI